MITTITELGSHFKLHREYRGCTQEEVAAKCGVSTNRSVISHLESGIRIPRPETLEAICEFVGLPPEYWRPFVDSKSRQRFEFEEALSELTGRMPTLDVTNRETVQSAEETISSLFEESLPDNQRYDLFNKVLVFYGIGACSTSFFKYYLKPEAFADVTTFKRLVSDYQKDAIRLFSTFAEAYKALNSADDLNHILRPLRPREHLEAYTERRDWADTIELIDEDRLPDLGYISAARVKQEAAERKALKAFLEDLARQLEDSSPVEVLQQFGERKKRKIDSLLRKFESKLPHGVFSPLFAPDPDELMREAARLAPKTEEELEKMSHTQSTALKNLSHYLTADYLDVYVATSMRVDADFVSVNNFVQELFSHGLVKHLKLRYFNPTQSWIDDRIAKGLVEALMLKRCSVAIYMAQDSDTFGKDSEASVALGQGKPVIVYVPKLQILNVDTEDLGKKSRDELIAMAKKPGPSDEDFDDTLDEESLMGLILEDQLRAASDESLTDAVRRHWADFDLYGGAERIKKETDRASYRQWLDIVRSRESGPTAITQSLRADIVGLLIAKGIRFERRAKVFREIHPLALQVILSTGVLNGILVVRSVEQCATALCSVIKNDLDLQLVKDNDNYRLIEKETGSTVRVISRHELLRNAFDKQHLAEQRRR